MSLHTSFACVLCALALVACSSEVSPGTDTGVPATDTGVAPTDTGVAPTDTGVAPTDTGVAPTDTGTAPSDTGAGCGDGTRTAPEQCDDGNTRPGDGCDAACMLELSSSCGDGVVDRTMGEQCDDGGTAAGDGCDANCRVEAPSGCGNGTWEIATGEECDDGNTRAGDGCDAACQLEPTGARCGDGTLDPGEICDDGNTNNGDACNPTCNLTNTVTTFAGTAGTIGRADGIGAAASFTSSGVLATDAQYLWMAEQAGMGGTPAAVLRRIDIATATVTTIANPILGSGGIATNGVDTVWVAGGNAIQSIATSAPYTVTTIHSGVAATNAATFHDGAPGTASFADVRGLTWFGGYLWIVDTAAAVIRRLDPATGDVTTVAGMPYATGGADGAGSAARFTSPRYIVSDNSSMLYISDTNGTTIRAMNATTYAVTTFAGVNGMQMYVDGVGTAARVFRPRGITADGGSIYFVEFNAHTVRQGVLATASVTTLGGMIDTTAGSTGGYVDAVGVAAAFASPFGMAYHPPTHSLFVSDANHVIRRIQ